MANSHRGEIEALLGDRMRTLVLTLGALAELESAFGADHLMALAERFGTGRLAARDLVLAGLGHAGLPCGALIVAHPPVVLACIEPGGANQYNYGTDSGRPANATSPCSASPNSPTTPRSS